MKLWGLLESNPKQCAHRIANLLSEWKSQDQVLRPIPAVGLCVHACALTFTCVKVTRFKSNANKNYAFVH